jgi:hypothetical protein
MFHRHDIDTFRPEQANRSGEARWYVDDEQYRRAVQRGMRLRSEVASRALRTVGQAIAGLFRAAASAPPVTGDGQRAALRRRPGGSIDIEHYQALARHARAEVAADLLARAVAWLGRFGDARRVRARAIAGG